MAIAVKAELCKAFCDELLVRSVPAGLAVSTGFNGIGGDPLGFYIVGPDQLNRYHLEDDGTTIPLIEAQGADFSSQTRAEAFEEMLQEYGVSYDDERAELIGNSVAEERVPQAAMKFVALLLRLQDMVLLTPERAASTFREDAAQGIHSALDAYATIRENEPIAPGIEFPADLLIQAPQRDPVAVFLAMSEQRVLEAVVAQMAALYEARYACSVIALLEKDSSITRKMRKHASNRLTAMPIYEGDQAAAIARIQREVLGSKPVTH